MRVVFPFVGDTVGGSHRSAALLIGALPAEGIEPVVVVHREGPLRGFFASRGIATAPVDELPFWKAGNRLAEAARVALVAPRLRSVLYRFEADLVHVNDGRTTITWAPAARLARLPFIVHQRTRLAPSRMTLLALGSATRVVAISEFTRSTLPSALQARTIVIANPFDNADTRDRKAARASLAEEIGLDAEVPVVAFVGTLQEQKRPRVAVAALAALHARGIRATLLLAGRTDEVEETARIKDAVTEAGLQNHVHILGYRTDVPHLLAACDLSIAPAVSEGHGRAVIEAMMAGTPVVAAASGGHIESITDGKSGILVPPDDPTRLADAITGLLVDPNLAQRLGKNAQAEARERYEMATHARAVAALYRDVLEGW